MKSLGNHEFDNNVEGLTPFIENLTSPVLAANLILDKVPDLAKQSNLKKSITFNISGTNVGVIGYLTPETKFLAKNNDVEYVDEITALKVEVAKLQNQGIKIIVALGHSGFLKDLQIAKEVKGLDLVIGGHSNTFLWNGHSPDSEVSQGPYPTYVKQDSGRSVLVVQAYAYTKYLGKLHIIFDADGEIVRADGQPILLDKSIPQDPEIVEIVERYKDKLSGLTDGFVGETANILDGLSCQYKECNLGNLITDAIFYTYTEKYKGPTWTDINVAIMQGGGIRASIDHAEREISKGDLLTVLPFGGNIAKLQLNGSTLLKMLEHSVANYDLIDTPGEFLQFSGMRVVYDLGKNIGNRVVKAKVRCSDCKAPEYFKLDSDKMYTILVPEFLAKGGDGYKMLIGIPYEKQGYDELHCTETYIRRHSPVFPEVEDRIILKTNQMPSKSSILSSPSLTLSLGNHEFDERVDGVIPFIRNLTSPVLAANLVLDAEPKLESESNLHKSIILNIDGIKIGIIGYLTPDTMFLSPKNKVEYEDEVIAIKREVEVLRDQNVNILIALGHSGFIEDLKIAKEVDGLDLVIGGHSNTFLWNSDTTEEKPEYPQGLYPTVVMQSSGRKVLVVQAYAYTKYMGQLLLTFNAMGEVVKHEGNPLLLDQNIPEDPEVLEIVNEYRNAIGKINNEVIGEALVFLDGDCRLYECNLGNLLVDSVLNYSKRHHNEYADVHIAVIQGGRIRTSINHPGKPFKITRGDLVAVMPFSDMLSIVTMNGTILKQTLEHSVSTWRTIDSTGQFLQMAGMEVAYDLAQPPGSRVVAARAICSNCGNTNMAEVNEMYEYKMFMPLFLADGGDNYNMYGNLTKEVLSFSELECMIDYVDKYSPVDSKVDGRITIVNSDKIAPIKANALLNHSAHLVISSLALQTISILFIFNFS